MENKYHWNNRAKAYQDFQYLTNLRHQLIELISKEMNRLHGLEFCNKSWHLMIGYWLTQFLAVVFDRWTSYAHSENHKQNFQNLLDLQDQCLFLPSSTTDASSQFIDDAWNNIFIKILRGKTNSSILKNNCVQNQEIFQQNPNSNNEKSINLIFRKFFKKILNLSFNENIKYVLTGTGFRNSNLKLIYLRLKLINPIFFEPKFPDHKSNPFDKSYRTWSLSEDKKDGQFEKLIKNLIPIFIPKCFLEDFSTIQSSLENSDLPKDVDVIFTSYKHLNDDVFKIWAGNELNSGAKLVLGQHGGGPFHKFNGSHQFELDIADLAVTTGNGNRKYPHLREVGQYWARMQYGKKNDKGSALLATVAMPKYTFDLRSMALGEQMLSYFKDQFKFYGSLHEEVQNQVKVRIYPFGDYGWKQKEMWLKNFPNVQLDEGVLPLEKEVTQCRLLIGTYMATTYNESLAANIPTVIYWDPRFWEWDESAESDFEILESVGIFHHTPESAAQHVFEIWDNVGKWWNSKEVQTAREDFCRKYAHRGKDIIPKLAEVLKEAGNLSSHGNNEPLKNSINV